MCRLLMVKSTDEFDIAEMLGPFAEIARNSREYQGHGWGCSYIVNGTWRTYRNISPVWEDTFEGFPKTRLLLAHARSAFRDEGITVENNMPFGNGRIQFIFNGELQGVRIRETGRIGAEKIFNFILRFNKGDLGAALEKARNIIRKRTRYIRAMNVILLDGEKASVSPFYNESPGYFSLHCREDGGRITVCSQPFPGESGWKTIPNDTIRKY